MKTPIIPILLLLLVCVESKAQNTFPATGNVGVGTSSPSERLHVYRGSGSYTPLLMLEDATSNGYTQFALKGNGRTYHLGTGGSTESGFGVSNKFFLFDLTGNAMRFVVDASGNMGIGTASPGNKLSIYGNAANASGLQFSRLNNTATAGSSNGKVLTLDASGNVILVNDSVGILNGWLSSGNSGTSSSTNFIGTTDNEDLTFRSNNLERFRLLSNGNLRVGSGTDKGKTFQVYGTGFFNGAVSIGTDSSSAGYKLFVAEGIRTRKVRVDVQAWADYVFADHYQLPALEQVEQYIQQHKHLPGVLSEQEAVKEGIDLGETHAVLLKKIEELTLYIIEQNKSLQKLQKRMEQQEMQMSHQNSQSK